jgi:outer membrane protein insertion porin family
VGVNSNNGVVGNLVLDIKNFDLFDWPRSFSEFIKFRAFRGAGQRLRIELQPGTELTRMRVDFVEPYFLDKPIRFNSSVYYFERGRESYDEERIGGLVGFGKRLEKGFLKNWYVDATLRGETIDIDSLDLFAPRDVRDVEGNNILTSVKGSMILDRTDSRWVPSQGDVINLSWEQFGVLGGDHFFSKLRAGYTRHWTLLTDVEERKHILSVHGDVGGILGDSPTFERFYAGGIGSIRGFEFRGISPRQGLDDDPVGGDFLAMVRTEYSFPLVGDNLRGLVFTDMGTVERDFEFGSWRASVGFGMRLHLEFFGPVPMEFDFAFPIAKQGEDEEQVFSFFIGQLF